MLSGCDYVIEKSWNYRITVEIETPEGIKTGSAVRQVRASKNLASLINPQAPAMAYRVIGEAVVIDLGKDGVLLYPFNKYSNSILEAAFPVKTYNLSEKMQFYSSLKVGTKKINDGGASFVWLPSFARNEKLQRLDSKDFEKLFGYSIKFKRTIIEITNNPVTWESEGIIEKLSGHFGTYRKTSFLNKN